MFKVKKGFTVIEIAVVIAVVAVIATVYWIAKNKASADIIMPQGKDVAQIWGRVEDKDTQQGIGGAQVGATSTNPLALMTVVTSTIDSSKGKYQLFMPFNADKTANPVTIMVVAPGYKSVSRTLSDFPANHGATHFQLSVDNNPLMSKITGKVTDKGNKIIGSRVWALSHTASTIANNGGLTNTDGFYTIGGLTANEYTVVVDAPTAPKPGATPGTNTIPPEIVNMKKDVTVKSGETVVVNFEF